MNPEWYFQTEGGPVKGPVTALQLKELASTGAISPSDLVKKGDTSSQWAKASAVKGLFTPQPQPTITATATGDEFFDDLLQRDETHEEVDTSSSENAGRPAYIPQQLETPATRRPQAPRRDFPALDLYAKVMGGLGKIMLVLSAIFLVLGIGTAAITLAWPLLVAGVSAAVLFLFAALGCYLVAEVVQLGTYYATLLEDIRSKIEPSQNS